MLILSVGLFGIATLRSVLIGTVSWNPAEYSFHMRMREMTPGLPPAVTCHTCGAAAGTRCLLHSGRPRNDLHINRKLCVFGAVEKQRMLRKRIQSLAKMFRDSAERVDTDGALIGPERNKHVCANDKP